MKASTLEAAVISPALAMIAFTVTDIIRGFGLKASGESKKWRPLRYVGIPATTILLELVAMCTFVFKVAVTYFVNAVVSIVVELGAVSYVTFTRPKKLTLSSSTSLLTFFNKLSLYFIPSVGTETPFRSFNLRVVFYNSAVFIVSMELLRFDGVALSTDTVPDESSCDKYKANTILQRKETSNLLHTLVA